MLGLIGRTVEIDSSVILAVDRDRNNASVEILRNKEIDLGTDHRRRQGVIRGVGI